MKLLVLPRNMKGVSWSDASRDQGAGVIAPIPVERRDRCFPLWKEGLGEIY